MASAGAQMRSMSHDGRRRQQSANISGPRDPLAELASHRRERKVSFRPALITFGGTLPATVLLSQFLYWHSRPRAIHQPSADERGVALPEMRLASQVRSHGGGVKQTDAELATAIGITVQQLRTSLARMREAHHVVSNQTTDGRRVLTLSGNLLEAWRQLQDDNPEGTHWHVCMYPRLTEILREGPERKAHMALAASLVLSQLSWWCGADRQGRCRARICDENGEPLILKTYEEIGGEVRLTREAVRGAVGLLKARGFLIVVDRGMFSGRPVPHYKLGIEALSVAWTANERTRLSQLSSPQ